MAMDIRRKVTHRSRDAPVQRAAVREMPTEAHARGPDAAGAGWEGEEGGDGEGGVFVVGGEFLVFVTLFSFSEAKPRQLVPGSEKKRGQGCESGATYLPDLKRIPPIRSRAVISQRLRAYKLMIARRRRNDIAMPRDLTGEARDRARDFVGP